MVAKRAGILATCTTDVYERQSMLAPLYLAFWHHFKAFVIFYILCAPYHVAGTRRQQICELGMLEELDREAEMKHHIALTQRWSSHQEKSARSCPFPPSSTPHIRSTITLNKWVCWLNQQKINLFFLAWG